MDEKKSIKVSLGTVICIFIIVILLVALGGVFFYYNSQEKLNNAQESIIKGEIKEESTSNQVLAQNSDVKTSSSTKEEEAIDTNQYTTLSVFTANKKITDPNTEDFYICRDFFGIYITISKTGKVEFSTEYDNSQFVDYGIVEKESDVKIKKNFASEITGFDKKVIDVEMGCYGQTLEAVYVVFLMEDGTLEYATIENLVKNSAVEGKVENVNNIQRMQRCSTWGYAVMALDSNNNLYDIGYILNK